jgi:hypothetical protein
VFVYTILDAVVPRTHARLKGNIMFCKVYFKTFNTTSQSRPRDVIGHRAIKDLDVSCLFATVIAIND